MGTGSLHASVIAGGRELSSYPDRCELQFERRTIAGETARTRQSGDPGNSRRAQGRRPGVRSGGAPDVFTASLRVAPGSPVARGVGRRCFDVGDSERADGRNELLDGCRHPRPCRHPDGAVRAWRSGTPQHGRICERGRRSGLPRRVGVAGARPADCQLSMRLRAFEPVQNESRELTAAGCISLRRSSSTPIRDLA